MKFGLVLFQTAQSAPVAKVAAHAENAGFESIWLTEHSHIPIDSVYGTTVGQVPLMYKSLLEPLIALAAAAQVTKTLRLATGVTVVPQHDPIMLAKQIATLDVLSGGRCILGVGAGWNTQEMRHHGTDPERRFGILRERVEAMKALWADEVAEFHGRYVDFGPSWAWPKPTQSPHPPIVVGGMGEGVLRRVVAYGDGWAPIARTWPSRRLAGRIVELRELAASAGRPRPEVSLFGHPTDPDADLPTNSDMLAEIEGIGVDRVIWNLRDTDTDTALRRIDVLHDVVAM